MSFATPNPRCNRARFAKFLIPDEDFGGDLCAIITAADGHAPHLSPCGASPINKQPFRPILLRLASNVDLVKVDSYMCQLFSRTQTTTAVMA
ncbi:hypothetical protein M413DRAFT_439123 [Hebeloma cylindrosporum]|uniref:Uncharacterized protein n=1 Tax=Hebeloma cylindrosporum TaxID=76867 RepID=A0A0C3CTN8_HEBCY|nr:hypothetical protein M413DRAFT_439123 [Hebeloma cylindrosporum h7]